MSSILKNIGNRTISGAQGFEVIVHPGQRQVYFPDLELLRNKKIKFIDVCDELTHTPSSNPLFSTHHAATITLRKKSTQVNVIDHLPLAELTTSRRKGNRLCFDDVFDFPASYIELSHNELTRTESIYFVVWFDEPFVANVVNLKDEKQINYFELPLTNGRTMFAENRTLFRKKFQSIMLSFPQITAENRDGITQDVSFKSFLTLQRKNLQFIQSVPLYLFYQIDKTYMLNLQNVMFDFTNSFIDVVNFGNEEKNKSAFFNCIVVD
jgi:hypothetical protein